MKFIIASKDGRYFIKIYHRNQTVLTQDRSLAMKFNTRAEADHAVLFLGRNFVAIKMEDD